MGSLFGYFAPDAGFTSCDLLKKMADRLAHRANLGWESAKLGQPAQQSTQLGHGKTTWNRKAQIACDGKHLLGYSGVLFKPNPEATESDHPEQGPIHLLNALRDDPVKQLTELDGSFVLAYASENEGLLVRDASGIKVLYWTLIEDRLVFASEIKALIGAPGFSRRLRPQALVEYFSFSFIPGENTMLEGVFELQPGHLLRFQNGQVNIKRWFRFEALECDAEQQLAESEAIDLVRQSLVESTHHALQAAPTTAGFFLSGGIDSSAVLATAAKLKPAEQFATFSIHFGQEYPNENEFIQLMTKRYQTDHHELEVRPRDFNDQLTEIVWRLDDPIGDPVAMPNYLLAAKAANTTSVVLNGEGGDPCFGGPKNIPMLMAKLYGPEPGENENGFLERHYLRSFERGYLDFESLLSQRIIGQIDADRDLIAQLTPFFTADRPKSFVNKLMAMNIRLKGANLILPKVDKMTSANHLLALAPLFSRQIIETSFKIPPQMKLRGNKEKAALKMAVADWVPQPIIDRPKSGMRVPVHFWFQKELRRYAKKHLSKRRLKRLDLFDPQYVAALLDYDGELAPAKRHGLKLWMLITFLLWYEQFFIEEK